MKSTYSIIVVISLYYTKASYQVQLTFPAAIDCDILDQVIEDIECLEDIPSDEHITQLCVDYGMDDEPDIKVGRIYDMTYKAFQAIVHNYYDCDDEMYSDAMDSVQPSFCRNCGAEGDPVEPDARNYACEACGQHTRQSVAVSLGIM